MGQAARLVVGIGGRRFAALLHLRQLAQAEVGEAVRVRCSRIARIGHREQVTVSISNVLRRRQGATIPRVHRACFSSRNLHDCQAVCIAFNHLPDLNNKDVSA